MKKKIHFRAKKYGWGWYPATPLAWFLVICYSILFIFILSVAMSIDTVASIVIGVVLCAILTALLLVFSYEYGEEPRWRWGGD